MVSEIPYCWQCERRDMLEEPEVCVLRLGHRPGRDNRMTTHVGLTARALGADRIVIVGEASRSKETIEDITTRFGGPFDVDIQETYRAFLREWPGTVVHLTMYGIPVQERVSKLQSAHADGPLLVVVGAEKISFDVFEAADLNIAVTNQPHSEVAGLAVFLDRLFDGRELDREWVGGRHRVVPSEKGKEVEPVEE